jgi:ATP-dependent exoDNAse (exonuclease V) alpha subunit
MAAAELHLGACAWEACWHAACSDPVLLAFLNTIRMRQPTLTELQQTLADNMHPMEDLPTLLTPDTTILCTHRRHVRRHNRRMLHWLEQEEAVEEVMKVAPRLTPEVPAALHGHHLARWVSQNHSLTHVAVGARVIITTNINKPHGLVNGATATVVSLQSDHSGWVQSITIRLDDRGTTHRVTRTVQHHKAMLGERFRLATFPLALAYALTAHRCQGMTLQGPTIIHVGGAFAAGILYVMLSRVTSRAQLKIIGELQPEMFRPVPIHDYQ